MKPNARYLILFLGLGLLVPVDSVHGQVETESATADSKRSKLFLELANEHADFGSTVQLKFRAEARRFGHLSRPWETVRQWSTGTVTHDSNRFDLQESVQRGSTQQIHHAIYSPETLFRTRDGRTVGTTIRDHAQFLRNSCRYSPCMILRHAVRELQSDSTSVRIEQTGDLLSANGRHHDEEFEIQFSVSDRQLRNVSWRRYHKMWGDQNIELTYEDWIQVGDRACPTSIKETTFGVTTHQVSVLAAEVVQDRPEIGLSVPDEHRWVTEVEKEPKIEVDRHNSRITFLHLPHTDSRTTVVEFDEFLVVIDAPVSSDNGELILAKIDELKFEKPIRYFAFGHHHPHYLAGVRPFIARGITILTPKKIVPYIKRLAEMQHSLQPDTLQRHPETLSLEVFEGETEISDGQYTMKLYDIGLKSKHTIDYLLFYFPAEKLILQDDGIWLRPGTAIRDRTLGIYQSIVDLKLDVVDCIQSWPTQNFGVSTKIKFSELESAVQAAEDTEDKQTANDEAVFQKLRPLVGKWKNVKKDEWVEYRLISRESALLENWIWPERKREALTVYHMDAERLMATHYCPIGNQPRLVFDAVTDDQRLVFKFESATNLPDRNQSHCVEFWLRLEDENTLVRSESYLERGVLDVSESIYHRVEQPDE